MNSITKQSSTEFLHNILEPIRERRSIRAFGERFIKTETIRSLFEAARWAPSSVNEQPWFYIYATKDQQPELWQRLLDTFNDRNKIWARHAPLLILSMARTVFTKNALPNGSAQHDLGLANAFLSLQAVQMGLQVHQLGGYDKEAARQAFNIAETYNLGPAMAVGYPGDPESLPDGLRQREAAPRIRLLQDEFVMSKTF